MDEESYWMFVDDDLREEEQQHTDVEAFIECVCVCLKGSYFKDEIWRRARSHCGS